mgnify:CR=1 FL=1
MTKNILGLDLGTNSIGWALVEIDHENKTVRILGIGSRILNMDAAEIAKFESGAKIESSAAQRTIKRSPRKLTERFLLRRDRLHCVLNLLDALPKHYKLSIEFENEKGKRSGKFKKGIETKLAYSTDSNGFSKFLFKDAYLAMEADFKKSNPELFYNNKKGVQTKIPYDWTLYYLRHKAVTDPNFELSKEQLAWITLSFNQKRGYEKVIGQDEKIQKEGELLETFVCKVKNVDRIENSDSYTITLVDYQNENTLIFEYIEESAIQLTQVGDLKEIEKISKYDELGNIDEKKTEFIINEILDLKVTNVTNTHRKVKENFVYEIEVETGWIKEQQSRYTPKWKDTSKDFIVKTKYDNQGSRILKGADKGRNISIPKEEDWTLMKLKTETSITSFNAKNNTKGVASFIYYNLLQNPKQKIKGGLVTVIERDYYREELDAIYSNQEKFHNELRKENRDLYNQALQLLYPNNISHQNTIKDLDFKHLINEDILMYQRDLKSKKFLIADCTYEARKYQDKETKEWINVPIKVIHKFNPLFQEFRLWQFIKRLRIIKLEDFVNNEAKINIDVTDTFLKDILVKEKLFEYLNDKDTVTEKNILDFISKQFDDKNINKDNYKWNFTSEKEPCNTTRYEFLLRTKRIKGFDYKKFLIPENEYKLWHFFYSVKRKDEFKKGLNSLFTQLLDNVNLSKDYLQELVLNFSSFGGYANDYGTYSEKAIKKLLPFLRVGKFWNASDVETILSESNHDIKEKVLVKEQINGEIQDFQGLWISSACYLTYGRYSEVGEVQYWKTPYDIESYLKNEFRQHSLNNPVVEKVLVETLHIVKDIWKFYGKTIGEDEKGNVIYEKLFDRIHIEMGREMKKNNKQKAKDDKTNKENRKANDRIIEILKELKKDNQSLEIKSPFQQEKLRLLEADLLASIEYDKDTVEYSNTEKVSASYPKFKITKKQIKEITSKEISKISKSDFERYKLWLDQRYQSPYTGRFIKLSDLFDRKKYEIEHILPQEKITLNAVSNKVLCESEINKVKGANTGYGFILNPKQNEIFCIAHNEKVKLLEPTAYEEFVKTNFDGKKREILLSKDIPDDFTNSQKNNMQYIAKVAMKLLSNIVREEGEDSYRSKHVLATNGSITSTLKRHWKLNGTWNELMMPRFVRLNELTNSNAFGDFRMINGHKVFVNMVPEETAKNFDVKRIDHRHHALDALIIALTTENHVQYLNNISSQDENDDEKLKTRKGIKYQLTNSRKGINDEKEWYFLPPAQIKTADGIIEYEYQFKDVTSKVFKDIAKESLQNTVASFKQKNRIIRQRWNKYLKNENGEISTVSEENLKSKGKYNVRKSLHQDTFYGKVNLLNHTFSVNNTIEIDIKKAIEDKYKFKNENIESKVNDLRKNNTSNSDIISILSKEYSNVEVFEKIESKKNVIEIDVEKAIKEHYDIWDLVFKTELIALQESNLSQGEIVNILSKNYKKVKVYEKFVASRFGNDLSTFASSDKIVKTIQTITDTGIQKILLNHLENYKGRFDDDGKEIPAQLLAFSPEGIKEMNENIVALNDGKNHQPIYKVRMADATGTKFSVSEEGVKSKKFVVTSSGSNAFCGVYQNGKDRKYFVPTLRESIINVKDGYDPCPQTHPDDPDYKLLFVLNPSDLVYVPTDDEIDNPILVNFNTLTNQQMERLYKFTDGSGTTMNFVPINVANLLFNVSKKDQEKANLDFPIQNELGIGSPQSKNQNSFDGIQIKSVCWKLKIDRLGNISKA